MAQTFVDFITAESNKAIVEVLCKIRANEAEKRGKEDKIKRLSSEYRTPWDKKSKSLKQIFQIMPPRRTWVQLEKGERTHKDVAGYQRISSLDYNKKALLHTIRRDRKNKPQSDYLMRLDQFIADFMDWVTSDELEFQNIVVVPIPKKYEKGKIECRPVSMFTDLKEAVVLVLINKYLTRLFDSRFYEESLAFRAKRLYHGQKVYTNHHNAIERICEYRNRFDSRNIFVAECDMKKFYDTVSHKIVRKTFNNLFKHFEIKNHCKFLVERKIVNAFLNAYTFPRNVDVFNRRTRQQYWKDNRITGGYFKWVQKELVEEGLYKETSVRRSKVGVPQGGALSGLIANAVLDVVDKKVESMLTNEDLYLRYCDDMILLSTDKQRCRKIFDVYKESLKQIRLLPHNPSNAPYDKKSFWEAKTKRPYKWALGCDNSPEWIGFVGYEVKRDGCVRIRKRSLYNEIKKQRKYGASLYVKINGLKRVSNDTITASVTNHLINMSVGRACIWNANYIQHELCWINGFRQLNDNKYIRRQIRLLDRCRNNSIRVTALKFGLTEKPYDQVEKYKANSKKKDERLSGAVRFYGTPYSYYHHFLRTVQQKSQNTKVDSR